LTKKILSSHIEENIINFDEKNVLMMKMIITLEIILITSLKWLESTLKRNQSMNELFMKSFINWRIIKEGNSWSYAWRFYHNRLRKIQESSIIFQDMILEKRNQSKEFSLWERFLMFLQGTFWSYKVKRTFSVDVFKDNTYLHLLSYLLMCFVRMFSRTFWVHKDK